MGRVGLIRGLPDLELFEPMQFFLHPSLMGSV